MLRKLISILLMICLLAGCAAVPAETTPADTRQYLFTEGLCCYHIPNVSVPNVNAGRINEKLYDIYYELLQAEVFDVPAESRFLLGLMYEVGQKGDVVSVTVLRRGDCDLDTYDVYYFSASTGEELTEEAVFAAFGKTEEEGRMAIYQAMEAGWAQLPEEEDPFFLEQKENTLASSNVEAVKPLIAENGELRFVGEFYALAGADSYMHCFDEAGYMIYFSCQEH